MLKEGRILVIVLIFAAQNGGKDHIGEQIDENNFDGCKADVLENWFHM